jgi:DNA repair protein RadA/Sms
MKKSKTVYVCDVCGHEELKWAGRCPSCQNWNCFSELTIKPERGGKTSGKADDGKILKIQDIEASTAKALDTGINEINRVLGGGIIPGSVVLIGGEPGIGKSTLMLQLCRKVSDTKKVLYISGEESPSQIKGRFERVNGEIEGKLELYFNTELSSILKAIRQTRADIIIIDSIQTIYSTEIGNIPGTVSQLKYCAQELTDIVKQSQSSLFFVAHVTKEGVIAGPRVVEHMVDTVLYFEHTGNDLRVLRAAKNRFGSVDELGLFRMGEKGLQQIGDPENTFLIKREGEIPPGVCIAPVHEGSRIFLVEIQALTVPAKGGMSRVYSDRIDSQRISRIAAIIEKHASLIFSDQDIYINVAGGIRIKEVGIELSIAIALYSARTGISVPAGIASAGELSLTGEILPVSAADRRINTASGFGIKEFFTPGSLYNDKKIKTGYISVKNIKDAVKAVFNP